MKVAGVLKGLRQGYLEGSKSYEISIDRVIFCLGGAYGLQIPLLNGIGRANSLCNVDVLNKSSKVYSGIANFSISLLTLFLYLSFGVCFCMWLWK